ncbi:hypothetical protein GR197_17045 [Rhizobium phaseoli]|uniref:Uncharacterized protein n=1 Tax=Rhizobium phaseoli TaxID=396 RepID=A0A7K3UEW5_9HYPH|nr:hypothetical protein [Rhizobium phaseoli]NEJ72222.1 hypothetical protein [Rhizobium phaseoli]
MAKLDLQFRACLDLWLKQPTPNALLQLAGADLKSLYRGQRLLGGRCIGRSSSRP